MSLMLPINFSRTGRSCQLFGKDCSNDGNRTEGTQKGTITVENALNFRRLVKLGRYHARQYPSPRELQSFVTNPKAWPVRMLAGPTHVYMFSLNC